VERLALLWDELDELVGFGRHLAAAMSHSVARRLGRRRLARVVTSSQA